jgi:hypothetical protein
VKSRVVIALAASAGLTLTSCEYVQLLRPSVLKQLNPRVVRLVNEFPEADRPNEAIVARLFAHGGLSRADRGHDGVFHTRIYAPHGQCLWYPSVIVMESAGDLEIEFSNDDEITHAVLMPGGAGNHGNPVTYSVNGKQYIGVPVGWGGWVEGYAPEMYGAPRGTALMVFALP